MITNDERREHTDNPGKDAAISAAKAIGGKVVFPELERKADAWDLWNEQGPEAVRQMIEAAVSCTTHDPKPEQAPTASLNRLVVAISIGDFLAHEFPPRTTLLGSWLPSQGLIMVYAYRGIGKTHFALDVAYAVASGGAYLGWQAPAPVGVMYIDGEMPGPLMQERLSSIVHSNEKEPTAPFILITPDLQSKGMPRIDTEDGQAAIESVLTDDIKLIVIDNISTLSSAKENDADGWTPVQAWALKQRATGRSVLFVHHSGKGGAQRGTSRREDVLDTVIALRRPVDYQPDQGAVFEVHFEKARGLYGDDVKPIEASLKVDANGVMSWLTRTVEDCTYGRVVEMLNDGLSQKDIANELNLNKSTISRHAKKAEALGEVKPKPKVNRSKMKKIDVGNGWPEVVREDET